MILRNVILSFLIILFSCSDKENKIRNSTFDSSNNGEKMASSTNKNPAQKGTQEIIDAEHNNKPYFDLSDADLDHNVFYKDTVVARTTGELIQQIKSNRLIKLIDNEYILKASSFYPDAKNPNILSSEDKHGLVIDSIKNLKIVGTEFSKISTPKKSGAVLKFSNAYNIHLNQIVFGHSEPSKEDCSQSVLTISHSYNFNISNCKLSGAGFGLITRDVYKLNFYNSEITACTCLLFDLEKSRTIEFKDAKFHNNNLKISVLGAFTNLSKEVTFLNCEFLHNKPKMAGNPAFNFMDNYNNIDDQILFSNCTFKNNKEFKWYGDKIKLDNCEIDSSDFIGLQKNN